MEEMSFELVLKHEMIVRARGAWEMFTYWNERMIS